MRCLHEGRLGELEDEWSLDVLRKYTAARAFGWAPEVTERVADGDPGLLEAFFHLYRWEHRKVREHAEGWEEEV